MGSIDQTFLTIMSIPHVLELIETEGAYSVALQGRLERWGFVEAQAAAPAATKKKRRGATIVPYRSKAADAGALQSSEDTQTSKLSASTRRAAQLVASLAQASAGIQDHSAIIETILEDLSSSAEPMRALLNFSHLADAVTDRAAFLRALSEHPDYCERLCRLLGFSQALADTLIRHPELMSLVSHAPLKLSRPALRDEASHELESVAQEARLDALRRFRRRHTLRIGLLDLESATWRDGEEFHTVVQQISDLAQVCVETALRIVVAQQQLPTEGFTVIAMGKFGARELNYSSDIDLIFIHDGPNDAMQDLGEALVKSLGASTAAGSLFRIDMRLRPEGKAGPLVTSIGYALDYYESYAGAWEWQALIKSRAVAGDPRLARRFRHFTRGITWARRVDDTHLREILEMKRRSEATPDGQDATNVKQGPGGIRDAEWIVQQLQMMVGPQHTSARSAATLPALEDLRKLHALTESQARELRAGYLFLRVLEHRLQLLDERAIRTLPTNLEEKAALARRMGCMWRGRAAVRWLDEEHDRYRREIRALCERMFWGWRDTATVAGRQGPESNEGAPSGPMLDVLPSLTNAGADAQLRLRRMAEGTDAHPVPAPLARQIHAVLPEALRHLDEAARPERALINLDRLLDASGNRLALLRSLAAEPGLARAVFSIIGGSEFLSDTLIRFPELLDLAAQKPLLAESKGPEQMRAECRSYCLAFRDRAAALRRWKQREVLRIGLRDLLLNTSPLEITREIALVAGAALSLGCDEVGAALRPAADRIQFCVIGMGKLGGAEMHYSSDADVIFCYSLPATFDDSVATAARWAEGLMQFMGERTEDGIVFEVDPRLRPEGRNGPLAPSVASYVDYFEKPGGIAVWERQALTRARYVAGNAETGAELMAAIRYVAFPENWQPEWSDELRHIKHRVETERGPRLAGGAGAIPEVFDVKLGPGALSDIEFTAQWLALRHGRRLPALRNPNTLGRIEAACDAGLLTSDETAALRDSYYFLRRAELRLQITQESAAGGVKRNSADFIAWARAVFDEPSDSAATRFESEWRRYTSATRMVMERVRDEL